MFLCGIYIKIWYSDSLINCSVLVITSFQIIQIGIIIRETFPQAVVEIVVE